MDENELKQRQNKEKNRMKRLMKAAGAEAWKIQMMEPVMKNTAWMCAKLEETIDRIKTEKVVIPYSNGGGQEGIRLNPLYQGYESLWKAYMAGMNQIMAAAGAQKESKSEPMKPKSVIALMRSQKQA